MFLNVISAHVAHETCSTQSSRKAQLWCCRIWSALGFSRCLLTLRNASTQTQVSSWRRMFQTTVEKPWRQLNCMKRFVHCGAKDTVSNKVKLLLCYAIRIGTVNMLSNTRKHSYSKYYIANVFEMQVLFDEAAHENEPALASLVVTVCWWS